MSIPGNYKIDANAMNRIREEAMEFAGIGLYRCRFDGTVLFMDREASKIFELDDMFPDPTAIAGRKMSELFLHSGLDGLINDKSLRRKRVRDFEYSIKTLRGSEKWILHDSSLIQDSETGEEVIQAIIRDITKNKRAEAALKETEQQYRTLAESANDFMVVVQEGQIVYHNRVFDEVIGYSADEKVGWSFLDIVAPEESERVLDYYTKLLKGDRVSDQYEVDIITKNGQRLTMEVKSRRIEFQGRPASMSVMRDITERKQAEQALRWRDAILSAVSFAAGQFLKSASWEKCIQEVLGRLGRATAVSRVYIFENHTDTDGSLTASLRHEWVATGISPNLDSQELQGEPYRFPAFARLAELHLQGKLLCGNVRNFPVKERKPFRSRDIQSIAVVPIFDGEEWWGFLGFDECRTEREWTAAELDELKAAASIFSAAIERERAEEKLRESEQKFRGNIEQMYDGFTLIDEKGDIIEWNRGLERITGLMKSDVIGRPICDVQTQTITAEQKNEVTLEQLKDSINQFLITGEAPWINNLMEMEIRRPKGTRRIIQQLPFSIETNKGFMIGVIIRDITEIKRAEEALRESEKKFRTLVQGAVYGIYRSSIEGRFIDVNPALVKMLGYSSTEELLKVDLAKDIYLNPEEREKLVEKYQKCKRIEDAEVEWKRKDGKPITVRLSGRILRNDAGEPEGFEMITEDITDRRAFETSIRQIQKLESLGVLAGGIAHDFNNLLQGILGNASLALMDLSPISPARKSIEEIEKASQRAAELTKQMLAYSGKGRFIIQPINLSKLIKEMTPLLVVSISKKTILQYKLASNLPHIEADAAQIHQVVMNLITNASDAASNKGGIITITTGTMECNQEYLKRTYLDDNLPEGEYVLLEVADTGSGMDEEIISKIFDPFFSTKFIGRGLGLAAVLGIVRGHRGAMKVDSEPGKGSTFKTLFPRSDRLLQKEKTTTEPTIDWQGSGTILLVDDEKTVRATTKNMLERIGFKVLLACDGREAVEVFRKYGNEISVVLLDMTMPYMDGEEAFNEIRLIKKDAKVILSSGYNEQEAIEKFAGRGLAGFIQKPYKVSSIIKKLREVNGVHKDS